MRGEDKTQEEGATQEKWIAISCQAKGGDCFMGIHFWV